MTVNAGYRESYDTSNLTSQKYQPLEDIKFPADRDVYKQLVANRNRVLTTMGLLPARLILVAEEYKHNVVLAEKGKHPPLVVVSTNRSQWIKASLAAIKKTERYDSVGDMNAVADVPDKSICPVIYSPRRIGNNRNVYIVVHSEEYVAYSKALRGSGITVVGWKFGYPLAVEYQLSGFGASRFAAIEFCKALWRQLDPRSRWSYAWLLDDNVIALKNCPGLEAVEGVMTVDKVVAGFKGATKLNTTREITELAKAERGKQGSLPEAVNKGIVQQAALWNIKYLDESYLNFSPMFVTSAEDVSIMNYFDVTTRPYLFHKGVEVIKAMTEPDGSPSKQALEKTRTKLVQFIVNAEKTGAVTAKQPPPVTIDPSTAPPGLQTISAFIAANLTRLNKTGKDDATSRAVEQIICDAIKENLIRVPDLDAVFQRNGRDQQWVQW